MAGRFQTARPRSERWEGAGPAPFEPERIRSVERGEVIDHVSGEARDACLEAIAEDYANSV